MRVKPRSYKPTKAELDQDLRIDATPDELVAALVTPVKITEDRE